MSFLVMGAGTYDTLLYQLSYGRNSTGRNRTFDLRLKVLFELL
jgi:hypothetical protein